jgi:hypothetical protein
MITVLISSIISAAALSIVAASSSDILVSILLPSLVSGEWKPVSLPPSLGIIEKWKAARAFPTFQQSRAPPSLLKKGKSQHKCYNMGGSGSLA